MKLERARAFALGFALLTVTVLLVGVIIACIVDAVLP